MFIRLAKGDIITNVQKDTNGKLINELSSLF